jgi:hypothetical protein
VMVDGEEKLAIQVVLSDDEERRNEWMPAEFRSRSKQIQYG